MATSRIAAEMGFGKTASQSSKLMVDKLIELNYLSKEQVEKIDKVLLNGESIPALLDCIYKQTGYDFKEVLKEVCLEKNKGAIQNVVSICQKLNRPLPKGGIFKNINRRAEELDSYFDKNPKPEKKKLKANYVRYLDSFYEIVIKEHCLLNVVQALYEKEKSDLIKHLYFWKKINLSNIFLIKTKENRKKKFKSPNKGKLLKEFISENDLKFHLVFFGSIIFILVTTLTANLLVNPITTSSEIITIVKEEISYLNYALAGIVKVTIKDNLSKKSKFLSDLVDLINNNQEIINFYPVLKATNQNVEIDSVSQKIIQ